MKRGAVPLWLAATILASPAFSYSSGWRELDTASWWGWNGSFDWEYYRSRGLSQDVETSYDAFRQRYGLDFSGVIWEPRFNRFLLGVDFYRDDLRLDGQKAAANTLGYRVSTTFFGGRAFPLNLFARHSSTDSSGVYLADSNRANSDWGADWTIATRHGQQVSAQYDRAAYDLTSPVSLQERRTTGNFEFTQRTRRRETTVRYNYNDWKELVNGSDFTRQALTLYDRTRFDNGTTLLFDGGRTRSDALYTGGERDELTQNRLAGTLDIPRRDRVGGSVTAEWNDNSGKFQSVTSGFVRGDVRWLISEHWDSDAGVTFGKLNTVASPADVSQNLAGAGIAARYNRDWQRFKFLTSLSLGRMWSKFSTGIDRTVTAYGAAVEGRVPFHESSHAFGSLSFRKDQTDFSGLGSTFDERKAEFGLEGRAVGSFQGRGSLFARSATYDTFRFGVQTSDEVGLEGSLSNPEGSVSATLSRIQGVSNFIPDPSSPGGPFLPGNDLVDLANVATLGVNWRFVRRVTFRAIARYDDRHFTTIGQERIFSFHPEVEVTLRAWTLAAGVTHYERNNSTTFRQDAVIIRVGRRVF